MDFEIPITDIDQILGHPLMEIFQFETEDALSTQGQVPLEHRSQSAQDVWFNMIRNNAHLHGLHKYELARRVTARGGMPLQYPPSVQPIHMLRPIMLSEMAFETHHRGRQVTVRVVTPLIRINVIMAVVEDEKGTATLLLLYNQALESLVPVDEIVRKKRIAIIKEPFFRMTGSEHFHSIRVDHVSDIVWLDDGDDRIPPKWKTSQPVVKSDSQSMRAQGNSAVNKKSWAEAEQLLQRTEAAFEDAIRGGRDVTTEAGTNSPSEKGLFRQARALYELQKYDLCLETLEKLTKAFPDTKAARPEILKVKEHLDEQKTGRYDIRSMYAQVKLTPPVIDCATFVGPVEVPRSLQSPDLKSRGLESFSTEDRINLTAQVVQKLYHNPSASKEFLDLHCRDYQSVSASAVDGKPVVDSFLIKEIIIGNVTCAPRDSSHTLDTYVVWGGVKTDDCGRGIWLLASFINHACIANCSAAYIGDMFILRATVDMEPNTELRATYISIPKPEETYGERQELFDFWGFRCSCELCGELLRTPDSVVKEREWLLSQAREMTGATPRLKHARRPSETITFAGETLKALGYDIDVCAPKLNPRRPARLELRSWGAAPECAIWALITLVRAFKAVAPELSAVAEKHLEVLYKVLVGEGMTFKEKLPPLKLF
ncbi:hypothetical protein PspLS_03954 [Pyricularia sp. CBS 133598]|nr:hypothetical protein PspLS_03954 [Pyricularia sp. CBS 133598]